MSFSWARVGAILQKELRDYRRNRFVIYTMAFLPLIFIAAPMVQLFTIKVSITSARFDARIGLSLLYMLILPAIIPSVLVRLLRRRRARAGHARTGPHDAHPFARSSSSARPWPCSSRPSPSPM